MKRAQKYLACLPRGTCEVKVVEREWGIERIYKSPDGKEHSIPESLIVKSDWV